MLAADQLDLLARWIDVGGLVGAAVKTPRCIVVLGRTSAGKTTLLNRMTGGDRPTGLGGVTREIESVVDGDRIWIDTPGIDDPDRAIDRLGDALDRAHGVLWVVDGLQPVTHTERRVVDLVDVPIQVVVSKADLVEEHASILARVATFCPDPQLLDLRRGALPPLSWPLTAGEIQARRHAVAQARAALSRIDPPVDPRYFRPATDLRPHVRALLDDLALRSLSFPDLMQAYRDELAALPAALVVRWASDPYLAAHTPRLPPLPETPDPTRDALEVTRLAAAGSVNALRELRAQAAGWLAEAQIALSDWEVPLDAEAADAYAHAVQIVGDLDP